MPHGSAVPPRPQPLAHTCSLTPPSRPVSQVRWDHIALFVRVVPPDAPKEMADSTAGELALLEATGPSGVQIMPWVEFVTNEWHDLYSRMALRRVAFERRPDCIAAFESFVNSELGKPYSLSLSKLSKRASAASKAPRAAAEGGRSYAEEASYFCSELVAQALMTLRVLPVDRSSVVFWPGDFGSQSPPLRLNEGCSMGDEQLIDFHTFGRAPPRKIIPYRELNI